MCAVSRESNPWKALRITEMQPSKADTIQPADHERPSIDMQAVLILIQIKTQCKERGEGLEPTFAPLVPSTLAVIAALELTPLPQTIRVIIF